MTTPLISTLVGLGLGLGIWLIIVGALRLPDTPAPTRAEPIHTTLLRLLGMTKGGPLHKHRKLALIGAGAGLLIALITGWWALVIILPVTIVGLPALFRTQTSSTDIEKLNDLSTWVRSLIGVLSGGGTGLEAAIRATLHSAPKSVRPSLAMLVARLDALQPLAPSLRRWADEMDDYAADQIAATLILESERKSGGITNALKQLANSLTAQTKARREIESERSSSRATVRVVTIIVIVVIAFAAFTGYLDAYTTPLGQGIALVFFAAYVGLLMWMRKISMGKPIPRFLPAKTRTEH